MKQGKCPQPVMAGSLEWYLYAATKGIKNILMINTAYTGTENTTPLYSTLSCDHFGCQQIFCLKNCSESQQVGDFCLAVLCNWQWCSEIYLCIATHNSCSVFFTCSLPILLHLSEYEALRCGGHFACVKPLLGLLHSCSFCCHKTLLHDDIKNGCVAD